MHQRFCLLGFVHSGYGSSGGIQLDILYTEHKYLLLDLFNLKKKMENLERDPVSCTNGSVFLNVIYMGYTFIIFVY